MRNPSGGPGAVQRLDALVGQLDESVALLARQYPWAFASGEAAAAATGGPCAPAPQGRLPLLLPAPLAAKRGSADAGAEVVGELQAALDSCRAATGIDLLAYSAPAAMTRMNDDDDDDDNNINDNALWAGSGAITSTATATALLLSAEMADSMPLTAALMAAHSGGPRFSQGALAREQVSAVLALRDHCTRHGERARLAQGRLAAVEKSFRSFLDGHDGDDGTRCKLAALLDDHERQLRARLFPVSGNSPDVWQRLQQQQQQSVAVCTERPLGDVVALSLDNSARLGRLLQRWSTTRRRYAALVGESNAAVARAMTELDRRQGTAAGAAQ